MIPIKDLINQKYGRLIIIKEVEPHIQSNGKKRRKMLCQCNCGNFVKIILNNLKKGTSKSCGCLQKENPGALKHGLIKHPLYRVWNGIKQRCYNSNRKAFKNYGGRGITVYEEWINDPVKFINWALKNGWKKGLLIDRINNDGNYEPNNVRFVDYGLNARNRRLLMSTNTSGYRGVFWNKQRKKWIASICINSKLKYLGYFTNTYFAALKYNEVAEKLNDGRPLNTFLAG